MKLHKKMRIVIPEWEKQVLDLEPELTYHRNYLQAVLKLNIIVSEGEDHLDLTVAEINQIPKDVKEYMEILCNENQILLKIQNHDKEMDDARKKTEANHEKYYFDLPNKG